MTDTLYIYWVSFLEYCGSFGFSLWDIPGLIVVTLAILCVIYAFYQAISHSITPNDRKYRSIKHSIFDDETTSKAP